MKIQFKSEVYEDIQVAYDWYESQRKGLGEDFLSVMEDSLSAISQNPNQYPQVYRHMRRCLMRKFPYGIFYVQQNEMLIVIGVLHTKRDPAEWDARI